MQLARILGSNYPFITNIPAYDGTILAEGELLMRAATWNAATQYYVTAAGGSNAETDAEDTIGTCMASSTDLYASKENAALYNLASAVPSKTATTGFCWVPAIVNPEASYFAFCDNTTNGAVLTAVAVTASTTWTTTIPDHMDGGWMYTTTDYSSTATYAGELRYATAAATTSITADSVVTTDTSTDLGYILPIGNRLVALNSAATGVIPRTTASSTTHLNVVENWITHSGSPKMAMRYWIHKGLSRLTNYRYEQELVMLTHCYRKIVA
jgi:hypothetical protein